MAQWGRNDQAVTVSANVETSNGAPIGTYTAVKLGGSANAHFGNTAGSRANVDVQMFGNTTPNAFMSGVAVGVFGVDATEVNVSGGPIAEAYVTYAGTGYAANAAVTITVTNGGASGVVNAHANNTTLAGKIDQLNISTAGTGYITNPTIAIAPPATITITANSSGFSNTTDTLAVTTANSIWQVNDRLYYAVPTANVAIAPLVANTYYYVTFANTSRIAISTTLGGANVDLTDVRNGVAGESHSITGDTATGYVVSGGSKGTGIAHAGWNIRREGTGGRAGRVHYECLVAMGSLGATDAKYGTAALVADASDDTTLPDA